MYAGLPARGGEDDVTIDICHFYKFDDFSTPTTPYRNHIHLQVTVTSVTSIHDPPTGSFLSFITRRRSRRHARPISRSVRFRRRALVRSDDREGHRCFRRQVCVIHYICTFV